MQFEDLERVQWLELLSIHIANWSLLSMWSPKSDPWAHPGIDKNLKNNIWELLIRSPNIFLFCWEILDIHFIKITAEFFSKYQLVILHII